MFNRELTESLKLAMTQFPAVTLTGPRQSGKTTLLRTLYPQMNYCLLESPDVLARVKGDPRGYIETHMGQGIIFDEAQNFPEIFSYLQEYIDNNQQKGQFVLSGSQNFLLLEKVSQSLAGRTAVLELLPLTYQEFCSASDETISIWEYLYAGTYPGPYKHNIDRKLWYESYIATYIERDVRQLQNIRDLSVFHRFLKLCAGRNGQLLNIEELAVDAGVSTTTAKNWLTLLEQSYILYLLKPHHKNFNKRLIKMPKLFFYDVGLVCHLLEIDSPKHLSMHSARGAIFEGFVLAEIRKYFYNHLKKPNVFFWRDYRGDEVDCIIELGEKLLAIEIKSSQTLTKDLFKALVRWHAISKGESSETLIYAGAPADNFYQNGVKVLNWQHIPQLF